jgi:hypothetical protein
MGRPRKYHTQEEREAARAEARKRWRLANPERWKAILARSYLKRKRHRINTACTLSADKVK